MAAECLTSHDVQGGLHMRLKRLRQRVSSRRGAAAPAGCGGGARQDLAVRERNGSDGGAAPRPTTCGGRLPQATSTVLASQPLDATIPGARSGKIVLDQYDGDALYFQNSNKFQIHHEFAAQYLSGPMHPHRAGARPSSTRTSTPRPIAASCWAR